MKINSFLLNANINECICIEHNKRRVFSEVRKQDNEEINPGISLHLVSRDTQLMYNLVSGGRLYV